MSELQEAVKEKPADLNNLKIPLSLSWRIKYSCKMFLQKLEYKFPIIGKILRFIGYRLVFLGELGYAEQGRLASIHLLHNVDIEALQFGSSFGYADEVSELSVAYGYWEELYRQDCSKNKSESWALYQDIIKKVSDLLDADKSIKRFFNFGVSFAYVDHQLALRHPDVEFIGIDRSKYTKMFNEDNFSGVRNMAFVTGDVFDYLQGKDFSDAVFFHTRTLVYLPKHFIERLYAAVREAGFKYITGWEQVGVSRETSQPFDFSYEERPSVLFRSSFFIHNYPALVTKAGYCLKKVDLLKTNHSHEDYRILNFRARVN